MPILLHYYNRFIKVIKMLLALHLKLILKVYLIQYYKSLPLGKHL